MPSVAKFLIERLEVAGVQHVFGVVGQHICGLFKMFSEDDRITLVNTADEAGAAFAADGYARTNGVGCVAVSHNVGAFKVINAVAAAYAERSPLIVLAGSPPNSVSDTQRRMFERITCASTVLSSPSNAGYEIDRVLEALRHHKRPVYIELPTDVVEKPISYDVYRQGTPDSPKTENENLDEALAETSKWIETASRPVILAGVEIARYDLSVPLLKFADRVNIPVASTMLSKSVVSEKHPMYLGVYAGEHSSPGVQEAVESASPLLMLGVMAEDLALTYMPSALKHKNVVSCRIGELHIQNHSYEHVQFRDFIEALTKLSVPRKQEVVGSHLPEKRAFVPAKKTRITTQRLFEQINAVLDERTIVVSDVGTCLLASLQLNVHPKNGFLGGALYGCMGTAIPTALGVGLARPSHRPLVLVGDGAFQMSAAELGTLAARRVPATVVVLNNHGYASERVQCEGEFNDVPQWSYHKITEVVGGIGVEVESEEELATQIARAATTDSLFVINVNVGRDDVPPFLARNKRH